MEIENPTRPCTCIAAELLTGTVANREWGKREILRGNSFPAGQGRAYR